MTKKSETKDEFPENDAPKKPDEKTEKSTKEIRQEKWDKVSNKIENTTDQIGCSIDEKIKETVVALNVFDVNTRQSCEGHNDDYGAGTPWVQIEAANEPEELYKGQEETLKKVAKDNGISVEDLKKEKKFEELYEEAMTRCEKNGETEESVAWQEENKKLRMIMEEIVSDFYKERTVSEDIKIRFNDIGIWGSFRIISGTEEDYDKDFKNMNEQEKEELGKRLEGYRKEMDDFTIFLKDKFFTEGEGYANSKRIKAQERIDREKLEELRKINIDWEEMEDFEKEYVEYFRSEEARKLRDKFFEVFENSVSAKQEINQEINHSLNTIRKTGLFDPNFLDKVVLVSSGDKKTYKFQEGRTEEVSREEFDLIEFMQGKRTDFVGINPKEEFEKYDVAELNDKQFLPFMFFEGKLSYDEFVAHEIAHNVFDREYIKKFGQYEIKENITDVSEEYREKIKGIIIPLIKENYPRIEAEKFSFNRQKIAEIFSLLYQREFCKKVDVNAETHDKVGEILEKFSENPELALSEFNKKYGRNCTMDDFYEENRILSLVVAPLLEKEYPNWKERVGLFFK